MGSYEQNSLELKISVGSDVKVLSLQQALPIEQTLVLLVSSFPTLAINCDCSHSSVKVLNPSIIGRYPVHLHRLPRSHRYAIKSHLRDCTRITSLRYDRKQRIQ